MLSIEKSGFGFSNPDFGFPNKTRNPKTDFDEPKSFSNTDEFQFRNPYPGFMDLPLMCFLGKYEKGFAKLFS